MNEYSTRYSPGSTRTTLLIVLVASAGILFPTIFWPFDYDQGTFAYGGAGILHGLKPYIDFWDIKPPNIFYTYSAAFAIFGNNVRAIRIFDYLNALLSIALLFTLTVRLWKDSWNRLAAVFASLAFIVQYYIFGHWDTAQTETYSIPLLLGAMLLMIPKSFVRVDGSAASITQSGEAALPRTRAIVSGILIGISFYFKFPNALFLLLIATAIWLYIREARWRSIGWLLAGFCVAIGLESLYLAWNGELLPLLQVTTSETASYVSSNYSGSFTVLRNIRTSLHALDTLWVVAAIVGLVCWVIKAWRVEVTSLRSNLRPFFIAFFGCIIALLIIQAENKGYTYHYGILLPWADLLIGAGVANFILLLTCLDRMPLIVNSLALGVILLLGSFLWSSRNPLQARAAELSRIMSGKEAPNGYIAGDSISDYVIAHTAPDDHIFIFGFQPYVYWKTGRVPTSKFINTIHFKPTNVPKTERAELLHDLIGNPPELFLVETQDRYSSQGNTNDDSRTTIRLRYPELEQLLDAQYTPADTIQQTIIYRKRHGLAR